MDHKSPQVLVEHLPIFLALGDDVLPVSVRFQGSDFSTVDDLIVVGDTPDGGQQRLSIGVR